MGDLALAAHASAAAVLVWLFIETVAMLVRADLGNLAYAIAGLLTRSFGVAIAAFCVAAWAFT